MRYLISFFGKVFGFLSRFKGFVPLGFAGMFLVIQFVVNWVGKGIVFAYTHLAKTIFASELIINQNVHLAIANSPSYNLWSFFEIVFALFVIYNFVKFLGGVVLSITGANEKAFGGFIVAIIIMVCLEVSVIKIIDGSFGFIPIKDGIIFLMLNLGPVFSNIFGSGVSQVVSNISSNFSGNVSNSSFQ